MPVWMQQVWSGLVSNVPSLVIFGLMSWIATIAARQVAPALRENWRRTVVLGCSIFVFLFLALLAMQKNAQLAQHSWPPLTKDEIGDWAQALQTYKCSKQR